jgi:hypothetical protein
MEFLDRQTRASRPRVSNATGPEITAEHPCTRLTQLARYVRIRGMDWSARRAAEVLRAHFDAACRRHREDEESGLTAAILKRHIADQEACERLLDELRAQHRELFSHWESLRKALSDIAFCRPTTLSPEDASRFASLYRSHVRMEDEALSAAGAVAPTGVAQ